MRDHIHIETDIRYFPALEQLNAANQKASIERSKWDAQAVLAVDVAPSVGDVGEVDLVQHALGAHARIHGALNVPNVRVLRGHVGAVETGVQDSHGDAFALEFVRGKHACHVGGCFGHVMAVVTAVGTLHRAPRQRPALRADHRHFAAAHQQLRLVQHGRHAQHAHGADVDGLDLDVRMVARVRARH